MNRSMPGLPVHHQLQSSLKFMSIESGMPSSHLILCCPLLLLPPTPPSIRVFSNESTLRMRWPKYWTFSFSISPSNEHPGLISFRMDWLDLLAWGVPESLQMVTAAMKLKDACSLKESYDHPRQHIKKQRHYFANGGPSSQGYGFSSDHVWMWELDYKESWAVKNLCF